MNTFEFENMKETPRTSLKGNFWLIAICILWTSTNLAHLPFYARMAGEKVAVARQTAAAANVATNLAAVARAEAKQEAVDFQFNAEWAGEYKATQMSGAK